MVSTSTSGSPIAAVPRTGAWIRALACLLSLCVALVPARAVAAVRRRPVPNYDGRGIVSNRARDAALFAPRVVLSPFWLLVQALRVPVSAALHGPIAYHLFEAASGVSTDLSSREAPPNRFAFAPIAVFDVDRRPIVGGIVDLRRFGDPRHKLRVSFATGGERAFDAEVWDRWQLGPMAHVGVRLAWWERPDLPTYGAPGTDGSPVDPHRAWIRRLSAQATVSVRSAHVLGLFVSSGVRGTAFDLDAAPWVAATQSTPRDAYAAWTTDAQLDLDLRDERTEAGVRFTARAHHGIDLSQPLERRWVVGELQAGAYTVLLAPRRILGIEAWFADSARLGSRDVPFPELPTLGGTDPLGGFLEGRVRSGAVGAIDVVYRWPVWVWLDGVSHLAVGGLLDANASTVVSSLHASWDIGLQTRRGGLVDGVVLFGLGSTRFGAETFGLERARLLVALTRSF